MRPAAPHIVLLVAWCASINAAPAADAPCTAVPPALQLTRDKLEIAKTQLAAAKENFGPARLDALRDTQAAILETEQIDMHCADLQLRPAPGSDTVRKAVGRHPHMSYASAALRDARRNLLELETDAHAAAARRLVERALEAVGQAFIDRGP